MNNILGNADVDGARAVQSVEKSLTESGPLQNNGGDEEVESHGAVSVLFQKSHQKSKTDENHDVDILEH